MKKYFFYSIIIILSVSNFSHTLFAQSQKEKDRALNEYFETIIKDTSQVVFVAKEKINSNETLKIFGLNDIMIIDAAGNGKGDDTLYNKKDFEIMKTKYKNKCIQGNRIWCNNDFWTKDNFRNKKVILESMNTNNEIESIFEKYNNMDIKIYGFSEPIYYQNKKYIIFTVNISALNSANIYIVVMKMINKKWLVTHKGSTNVFN